VHLFFGSTKVNIFIISPKNSEKILLTPIFLIKKFGYAEFFNLLCRKKKQRLT